MKIGQEEFPKHTGERAGVQHRSKRVGIPLTLLGALFN